MRWWLRNAESRTEEGEKGGYMKAVVFDMDGVLFDTEIVCMKAWIAVAEENGMEGMETVFPHCIGLNSNDSKRIILNAYGADFDYAEFRKQTHAWFVKYIEENGLPIKPGVEEILGWLKTTQCPVGLASSTVRESVIRHLELAKIREHFMTVVTGDMVEHSKPQPDIYLRACKELGVEPKEAYAIEDSPNGIKSAFEAGMKPILVPDMIAPNEEMRRMSHKIFRDLREVMGYLKGNLAG